MLTQILPQQPLIQWLPGIPGARMRVRVHKSRQQPPLGDQVCRRDRLGGPPITIGIQVHRLATGSA
jgi:hypothetical protein